MNLPLSRLNAASELPPVGIGERSGPAERRSNNTIYIFAWGNNPKRARLKGRPCKLLAAGAMNSCEVVFVDTGEHEIVSRRALRTIPCQSCGWPLIEADFNTGFARRSCDHFNCALFAQTQGLRKRSEADGIAFNKRKNRRLAMRFSDGTGSRPKGNPEHRLANDKRKLRPGYQPWLERKKRCYHELRKMGYTHKEAALNSSDKRMREIGIEVA